MPDLSDADPVSVVLAWLRAHPRTVGEFGGIDRITGQPEAPWPHLVVTPGAGGDVGDLTWNSAPEVTLEVYGDPDGSTGSAECRRLLMVSMLVAKLLPERDVTATEPVVTRVEPSGVLASQELDTGQSRWTAGLLVTIHPPTE